MKVAVTGASGFIGGALCRYLKSTQYDVLPIVRKESNVRGECVAHDSSSLAQALRGCKCVVHLAGQTRSPPGWNAALLRQLHSANVDATIELAARAVDMGVRRFVFISSAKVHGERNSPSHPFRPEDPVNPGDPYAISKLDAEYGLSRISKDTGLEVVVVRPPVVYGPGVRGGFLAMIRWVKCGVPLPFGAVDNLRSAIALENLVSFIALCADAERSPNAAGKILLVADGEDVSTTELLRRVASAYGCRSRLFSLPVALMRPTARCLGMRSFSTSLLDSFVVDDTKSRQMLKWQPVISMHEQLKAMAGHDSIT